MTMTNVDQTDKQKAVAVNDIQRAANELKGVIEALLPDSIGRKLALSHLETCILITEREIEDLGARLAG